MDNDSFGNYLVHGTISFRWFTLKPKRTYLIWTFIYGILWIFILPSFFTNLGSTLDDFKQYNTNNVKVTSKQNKKQTSVKIALLLIIEPLFVWNERSLSWKGNKNWKRSKDISRGWREQWKEGKRDTRKINLSLIYFSGES